MMVLEVVQQHRTTQETHAGLFGAVSGRWPAWFFDAWNVISGQIATEQTLRFEEAQKESGSRGRH